MRLHTKHMVRSRSVTSTPSASRARKAPFHSSRDRCFAFSPPPPCRHSASKTWRSEASACNRGSSVVRQWLVSGSSAVRLKRGSSVLRRLIGWQSTGASGEAIASSPWWRKGWRQKRRLALHRAQCLVDSLDVQAARAPRARAAEDARVEQGSEVAREQREQRLGDIRHLLGRHVAQHRHMDEREQELDAADGFLLEVVVHVVSHRRGGCRAAAERLPLLGRRRQPPVRLRRRGARVGILAARGRRQGGWRGGPRARLRRIDQARLGCRRTARRPRADALLLNLRPSERRLRWRWRIGQRPRSRVTIVWQPRAIRGNQRRTNKEGPWAANGE